MHMLKSYEDLRNKLEREVDELSKNEFTEGSVDLLHKLVGSLYKINCLIDMEHDGEQSHMMMPHMRSYDNFRHPHADYTYRGWDSERGYSRDNARQKMIQKLETLKDDTMSDYERKAINNCIEEISR